eukprot:scaffold121813_cov39-Tisochrysis_lutea.AAC.2
MAAVAPVPAHAHARRKLDRKSYRREEEPPAARRVRRHAGAHPNGKTPGAVPYVEVGGVVEILGQREGQVGEGLHAGTQFCVARLVLLEDPTCDSGGGSRLVSASAPLTPRIHWGESPAKMASKIASSLSSAERNLKFGTGASSSSSSPLSLWWASSPVAETAFPSPTPHISEHLRLLGTMNLSTVGTYGVTKPL